MTTEQERILKELDAIKKPFQARIDALEAEVARLREALIGVIRVADRKTDDRSTRGFVGR